MQDFEKLGAFYLGREYDYEKGEAKEDMLLYDSKDLVTHAVCVGMTGSGITTAAPVSFSVIRNDFMIFIFLLSVNFMEGEIYLSPNRVPS